MNDLLGFAALGLGVGAVYAALSVGVVLTYKGSGVINFSHGAIALYIAYIFAGLREGRLMIPPIPNPLVVIEWMASWIGLELNLWRIPHFVDLGSPVNMPVAFIVSLIIAGLLGLVLHFLVFKPLRDAPPLAKTAASVGVLLVLQAIIVLRFGSEGRSVPAILPGEIVRMGSAEVPLNRLILLGLAAVVTIVLILTVRMTRMGTALRAASENEVGATLIGLSPNKLAAGTWVISCLLAGLFGILYGSTSGLDATTMVFFVVPALGAALVGGMQSFGVAAIVALGIGVIGSVSQLAKSEFSWFPQVGAAEGISVVVIVLAVVFRGRAVVSRGTVSSTRLPAAPEPGRRVWQFAFVAVAITLMAIFLPYDIRGGLLNSMIFMIIALSLVVATGFAGQLSLFQMGLAGLAALSVVRWAQALGVGFPFDGLLALATAAVVGVVVGLLSLRVRGVELAILTMAVGYAFEAMVLRNPEYLKPEDGILGAVQSPSIGGFDFGFYGSNPLSFGQGGPPNVLFVIFVMLLMLAAAGAVLGLRRSDLGRRMLAVRGDERAAAGLGINVGATKLIAFSVASVIAGLGGVLMAYQYESVSPSPYVVMSSITILAFAYLGGIGTVGGAAFTGTLAAGGIGFVLINRIADVGELMPLIGGLGLIVTAILNPEGIAGVMSHVRGQLVNRVSEWRRKHQQSPDSSDSEGSSSEESLVSAASQT